MPTVAHLAKKLLSERMLLDEYVREGIINYVALAEQLKPRIDEELSRDTKPATIAMALRRITQELHRRHDTMPSFRGAELMMKGGLCDIAAYKSSSLFPKLKKINDMADFNRRETLNMVHGDFDVSIIIDEKFRERTLAVLEGEKILAVEEGLVAITVRFGKEKLHTPGVTYSLLRQLVLLNINLIEIVSSLIEITFIISKKDAVKGYNALQGFLDTH
ncbi:hypothetical protein HYX10_05955 [Candidatus Woesearchaeota archaeon]|nr:hypothetical protein [Candidatus Woesearchaeota archaeon]